MAIKGYLSDIKFVEVLKITGKYNGRLSLWNFAEKKQYEYCFNDQNVIYFNYNGSSVTNVGEIKKHIFDLTNDAKSYYAFQHEVSIKNSESVVTVPELVEYSLTSTEINLTDEVELPNLQTKFEITFNSPVHLHGQLKKFWEDTFVMFKRGCSGDEIIDQLNYPEQQTRESLYKLRLMGFIKPARMFKAVNPSVRKTMMARNLIRIANNRSGVDAGNQTNSVTNRINESLIGIKAQAANSAAPTPPSMPSIQSPPLPQALQNLKTSVEDISIPPPSFIVQTYKNDNVVVNSNSTQNINVNNFDPPAKQNLPTEITTINAVESSNANNESDSPEVKSNSYYTTRQGLIKRMLNSLFRS